MDSHNGLHIMLSTIEQTYLRLTHSAIMDIHNSIMASYDIFHMRSNVTVPTIILIS